MNKRLFAAFAAVLLLLTVTTAYAQFGPTFDTTQPKWNIHGGAAWMFGDNPDDVEIILGIGYETPFGEDQKNWFGLSVDYVPVSSVTGTQALVPVLIYLKGMGILGDYRVWGAVGMGARWAEDDIPEMRIDDGFDFAWSVQVGVDFTETIFGQVRYIAGDDPGDDAMLTTELGYRF